MTGRRTALLAATLLSTPVWAAPAPERKPEPATQLTFRPEGCTYSVVTPDVEEASASDTGTGSVVPDHIHASFAGDPATSFAVNWRTPVAQRSSFLLLGTDREKVAAAKEATKEVQLRKAHTLVYRSQLDTESTRVHEAHLCGLKPNTTYFYKVGTPGVFSAVYAVRTAPVLGPKASFRFGISGDARDSVTVFANAQKGLHDAGAAFQIFTGDAVMAGTRQVQWNALFEATTPEVSVQDVLATTPFMVANGNHESLSINYLAQFALPQRPDAKGGARGEDWYAFDYGSAHFVSLNDTTADEATMDQQTAWLDEHLSKVDRKKTPWLFVYHHRALYSCGSKHGSDVRLRQRWQPLFDKYKVDIVFNGHDHQYERSKPMRGLRSDGSGIAIEGPHEVLRAGTATVYMVAAGAGAGLYPLKESCPHTAVKEQAYHYVVADVSERELSVKVHRLDGSVIDSFVLRR